MPAALAVALAACLATSGCATTLDASSLAQATTGDTVELGTWEQDGDSANGPEPLTWVVLDRIDDEVLLLSTHVLESRPYHATPFEAVTWATSDLRSWLDGEFREQAFTPTEQALLVTAHNQGDDNPVSGTPGGPATTDTVFLLSATEAAVQLDEPSLREFTGRAQATQVAAAGGVHVDADGDADWWLRSPGHYPYTAQYVAADGQTMTSGAAADSPYGVRPAVWVRAQGRGA